MLASITFGFIVSVLIVILAIALAAKDQHPMPLLLVIFPIVIMSKCIQIQSHYDYMIPDAYIIDSRVINRYDCFTIKTRYVDANEIKDSTFYIFNDKFVINCGEKE